MIIVDPSGRGNCLTVQEAIDALPEGDCHGIVIGVWGEHILEKPIDIGNRRGIEIRGGVFHLPKDNASFQASK